MRLNVFLAQHSTLSRRGADRAISEGRVTINDQTATLGQPVHQDDKVALDGRSLGSSTDFVTIMLNKPVGYVCSRAGQGSKTIYELLPTKYHHLNPVGRLDKDSSGLLLLTNDGNLANQLTHPRYQKTKVYEITLDKPLEPLHQQIISDHGIELDDGNSQLTLEKLDDGRTKWHVTMREGRNRQIRRTFAALNYRVINLHRTSFGDYRLSDLRSGAIQAIL